MGEYFYYQLLFQSPLLLAYIAGLILALIFLKRAPAPSVLTLIATVILLLTTIGNIIAQTRLLHARTEYGLSNADYGRITTIIAIIASLLHMLAIACLLAAVFIGRRPPPSTPTWNR